MSEDLKSNLANYKLQLQQVEAALTTDPTNEDLQKLKHDLQEVIELTTDLAVAAGTSNSSTDEITEAASTEEDSSLAASVHVPSTSTASPPQWSRNWKSGDQCLAQWSEDQQYYEATVDEILDDGSCTVTFEEYGNTDVTQVTLLHPLDERLKRGAEDGEGLGASKKPKTKKDLMAAQREYKRKKNQKKAQRQKQMEEERETEKNKWLSFNSKTFAKTNKGRVKKSIFASPDNINGRVGVGTCGIAGRPMTEYQHQEKWKK